MDYWRSNQMTERAQQVMEYIWQSRNNGGADTENKLVAAIMRIVSENVVNYNAQNDMIVLDKNDMLNLASEIEAL
jgi:hypothetical protein